MVDSDAEQTPVPALSPEPAPEPARRGLRGPLQDRPFSVYLVLAAGLAMLVVLLTVVVLTGRNDNGPEPPICLPIAAPEAERAITRNRVERVNVLTESGKPETGPLALTLDYSDGNCRELPKGVQSQADFYRLIGVITVYNQTRAGEQRIVLAWRQQGNIPLELLATATLPTTATVSAASTTEPPTPSPAATATPPATATSEATSVPIVASPILPATPIPTSSPTPIATSAATATARPGRPLASPPARKTATPAPATPSAILVPASPNGRPAASTSPPGSTSAPTTQP